MREQALMNRRDLLKNALVTGALISVSEPALPISLWGGSTVVPMAGQQTMAHPERLPLLYQDGDQTGQSVSYDPSGANNDGNFRTAYTRYIDSRGEYVIFDAYGPGCLYRQQINVWWSGVHLPAGKAHIRYYFDDETTPRIDMPIDDFFSGKTAPFTAPFTHLDPLWRFGISYFPLPFTRRLKITTTADFDKLADPYNAAWYQYTYLTYPDARGVTTWQSTHDKPNERAAIAAQWNNLGADPKPVSGNRNLSKTVEIPAGATRTLLDLKKSGSIASLKFHLEPYSPEVFYHAILRVYWDDSPVPAIDVPIGHFFGGGGEKYEDCRKVPNATLKTLFYGFDGATHTFYCYWPMPFWRSARIELKNESHVGLTSVTCDVEYKPAHAQPYPQDQTGYFHAKRTISRDPGRGLFATAFEETGHGHVVGQSFYTHKYAMDGDEFTYIDGCRQPRIHGDGTEDDHNQGFGGSAIQKPLWGGLVNGYQGAYRIYMNDSYIFHRHIKINYGFSREGGNDFGGETDVTVFYYKSSQSGNLVLTDCVDVGDAASEKDHRYAVRDQTWSGTKRSGYDGYERNYEYDLCRDSGRAFRGHSEFVVAIAPDNNGVKLRRRIYRCGNGVQRANVYVNGIQVKECPWYICTLSSAPFYQGWFDADFEIPAVYTRGKRSLHIRVEYVGGGSKPEINEFYYWIYSYLHRAQDTQPRKITGLTAAAAENLQVNLNWAAAPATATVQQYIVYRSLHPNSSSPERIGITNAARFTDYRVKPGTAYFYRVAAMNLSQQKGSVSEEVHATTGPAEKSSIANFVGTDSKTMGNWATVYGADGFIMPRYFYGRDCQAFPNYISAVEYGRLTGHQFSTWNTSTDSSLLTSPISYCARYLGAVETSGVDSITVYVNDAHTHELAIYACDFDKAGRQQSIEILDLEDHVLSPAQKMTAFEKGCWLRYKFSGSFKLRLTNLNHATTAALSALMFGNESISE